MYNMYMYRTCVHVHNMKGSFENGGSMKSDDSEFKNVAEVEVERNNSIHKRVHVRVSIKT